MKAITVEPGQPGTARSETGPKPEEQRDRRSVNANKRHWYKAAQALAEADRTWLAGLITRREKPENFRRALERTPDDIKVVIQFSEI